MLAIAALVAALYLTTRAITVSTYTAIERRDVSAASKRALHALDAEVTSLVRTSADYAEWDDALAFSRGEYPEFLDNNAVPEAMQNLGVDFIAVVWPSTGRVEGRSLITSNSVGALREDLGQSLQAQVAKASPGLTRSLRGVIRTPTGSWLIATNPIMSSSRRTEGDAYLAVGRTVDAAAMRDVSTLAQLPAGIVPAAELPAPGHAGVQGRGSWRGNVFVEPLSEDEVRGSVLVPTITGLPAFALQVTMPRTAHVMGQQSADPSGLRARGVRSSRLHGRRPFARQPATRGRPAPES